MNTVEKKQNKHTEHGKENLQMKGACLCTQMSGSSSIEENW